MPVVELRTMILAPIGRCFDLARSIEFHVVSAARTQETAVRGRTKGLIEVGETVTWRARHPGIWQELTVEITIVDRPRHFQDAMTRGAFATMQHDHYFSESKGLTEMFDKFMYRAPFGVLGALVDRLYLKRYMRRFLVGRALLLKSTAESDEWRGYLVE